MNSRTEKSIKNIKYSLIGQLFGIILNFINRTVFINVLSSDYLGLSGLFSNMLSILSLTDLGFGTAIAYELYKPLSDGDYKTIKSLMNYFKKIYIVIGTIMIVLGFITIPLYPYLIKELPQIENLNLIYILFILNSSFSYFFAYKRILLISDQKKYVETIYKYTIMFLSNIFQILFLLLTKDYIVYLLIRLLFTIIENIIISIKVNKIYPFLNEKDNVLITNIEKNNIFRNVKSMFLHRFGGVIKTSTDNIVTSKFVSLDMVGLYSNYYLVISAIQTIVQQIFNSLVSSVGNLNVTSSKEKKTEIFFNLFFVNFCIYTFVCNCLLNLINPFINLWLGEKFLLSSSIVIIIIIELYITGMRKSLQIFREATGNYSFDWFSPIIEVILNIAISIFLAIKFGLIGVFLGTIISSLLTNFWIEPYIIIKESFECKLADYYKAYFKYTMTSIFIFLITYFICNFLRTKSIIFLLIKGGISTITTILIILLLYRKSNNYITIKNIFKTKVLKILV